MNSRTFAAAAAAIGISLSTGLPAAAAPTAITVTIPLQFGGHGSGGPREMATAAEVRAERRLRLVRYLLQLTDAMVSAIGYRAYSRCLSCLAYPGGGPRASMPVDVASLSGNRPAEADPLVQPFSRGGFFSLGLGTLAYDFIDARIERRWSTQRRMAADIAEIGAHAWGISTWLPEIAHIAHDTARASACGVQWQAKRYGEAFSEGCVNAYDKAGAVTAAPLPATDVLFVCAPARFTHGTYLFATPTSAIVASGTPCTDVGSPHP